MADAVTSFSFDPRAHLEHKGLRGLWRMLQGYRLRYLGAMGQVRRQLGLRVTDRVQKPAVERQVQSRQGRVL